MCLASCEPQHVKYSLHLHALKQEREVVLYLGSHPHHHHSIHPNVSNAITKNAKEFTKTDDSNINHSYHVLFMPPVSQEVMDIVKWFGTGPWAWAKSRAKEVFLF